MLIKRRGEEQIDEPKISDEEIIAQNSIREGNISLVLDSYNEIFSDFDPRHYSQRALSDDFLVECKKAARDKDFELELRLLIPKLKRNIHQEFEIKKRLRSHFQRHYHEKLSERKKIKNQGIAWFLVGTLIMMLSAYLYGFEDLNFFLNIVRIMSEPAAWFLFWEGLNTVFMGSKDLRPDYDFYKKMSNAKIYFLSY